MLVDHLNSSLVTARWEATSALCDQANFYGMTGDIPQLLFSDVPLERQPLARMMFHYHGVDLTSRKKFQTRQPAT